MKFTCAAILALGSIAASDAFVAPMIAKGGIGKDATRATTSTAPLAANPNELSVEEQARMFREMMAQQQGGAPAVNTPVVPVAADVPVQRVAKTDRAGRPVGRNRDADTIANTSDLYFAQLKRDSTVRTLARIQGEDEVAEKVFEDEGIKQLDELLQKNPYLKGQKEKEQSLIDTIPDEMLAPYFDSGEPSEEEKAKSGPSYRKKLMERKQTKQATGVTSGPSTSSAIHEPTPQPVIEQAVAEISPPSVDSESEPPMSPSEAQHVISHQATIESPPVPQTSATSSENSGSDETRQKLRTLMGMILKHRGGPGFGKGRLKGPEINRFESLLQEVSDLLREEAKMAQPVDKPLTATKPPATSGSVVEPTPIQNANPSPPQTTSVAVVDPAPIQNTASSPAPASVTASTSSSGNIDSTIACIEGAITMYKNSPPELQSSVLVTLRAALVSAVDTCNDILAAQPPPSIPGNPEGRIDNTIAVIEGAVTMYRNSPPALKESVLVTLRAALISAVETCANVIGPDQTTASLPRETVSPAPAPAPAVEEIPAAATPETTSTSAAVSTPSPVPTTSNTGADPNSKLLEGIYDKVNAASGDGRLGLRSDLTPDEAHELADQLVEMRSTLMQELESGIPDSEPVVASQRGTGSVGTQGTKSRQPTGSTSGQGSKYQEMLAKVRAEKAAG
mmetsp:Transcript_15246/g.24705  ORF Transcript_15246/g.24705 Transcript_15246/m.24705 type:complete len:679 (-) Transcript_15246:110-2146(-)